MTAHLRPAAVLLLLFTLLLGLAYPLAMTGIAQALLPWQAQGSPIKEAGRIVGSALIGSTREMVSRYNQERLYDKDGANGAKFWLINCTGGLYKEKQEIAIDGKVVLFSGEDALED